MRRITCPQRAIDPSIPFSPSIRPRTVLQPRVRATSLYPHVRTTSASFSTTPTFSFLLGGKQDKKKHQQFVRRWQKRLLGDSEPIGAHVDPYDPTSPVRIAPEEQGEEIEVLEEENKATGGTPGPLYEEARNGRKLRHVGGKKWAEQLEEGDLAKEFEKLTMRTYTPLTLKMASQIEDLTGTMYTLRDGNLMMAQEFHNFTGKPYTYWSFGRWTRVRDLPNLRKNFHRAVIEIYALKQAGKDLDISASANRGVYDEPKWLKGVKLQRKTNGDYALAFPGQQTLEGLLEEMERLPEWSQERNIIDEETLLAEEGEEVVVEEPEPPTMDPDTPSFKRAALVSQDPNKKAFDFMSNRPVPRTQPSAPVADTAEKPQGRTIVESEADMKSASTSPATELAAAATNAAISDILHRIESGAQSSEENVAALRQAVRGGLDALSSKSIEHVAPSKSQSEIEAEAKWRHVPLTDPAVKSALTKRLVQLTGLYISDPNITSASTLGDLYGHLCAAAKPEPAKLHTYIHVEGQRQLHKANELAEVRSAFNITPREKPHVGTLLKLGNVEVHRHRPNKKQERVKIGLQKAVSREIKEKGLVGPRVRRKALGVIEGTRQAPAFGVPINSDAAQALKDRTERKRMEWQRQGVDADRIIRERNTVESVEA